MASSAYAGMKRVRAKANEDIWIERKTIRPAGSTEGRITIMAAASARTASNSSSAWIPRIVWNSAGRASALARAYSRTP
jgi:hypothetical protein